MASSRSPAPLQQSRAAKGARVAEARKEEAPTGDVVTPPNALVLRVSKGARFASLNEIPRRSAAGTRSAACSQQAARLPPLPGHRQ